MTKSEDKHINIHANHRQRLRQQAEKSGLVNLNEHQVVELLLTYCIPRKDVNEIAHNLINEFGNLKGILDAEKYQLMKIDGMGEVSSSFLNFLQDFFKVYIMNRTEKRIVLNSTKDILDNFADKIKYLNNEELLVILTDKRGKVITTKNFSSADKYSVEIPKYDILNFVSFNKASGVIFLHNHTGKEINPSKEDISFTTQTMSILSFSGAKLIDHIIVNENSHYSFRNSFEYRQLFYETDKISSLNNKSNMFKEKFISKFDEF